MYTRMLYLYIYRMYYFSFAAWYVWTKDCRQILNILFVSILNRILRKKRSALQLLYIYRCVCVYINSQTGKCVTVNKK
jgi:hypothetical protein